MPPAPSQPAFPSRYTDHVNLGAIAKHFPQRKVRAILRSTGRASQRQRQLPAHVMVYYVIALALFMDVSYREVLRCLLEGLRWFSPCRSLPTVASKSAISQARTRLGVEPVRLLHDEVVRPVAIPETKGAWYRRWRLVGLDGSTLDVADTTENAKAFGRPGASRGKTAFPQIRFVSMAECGTHVLFGSRLAGYHVGEATLAKEVVEGLRPGMLCLGDRNFFSYEAWQRATKTGADVVWRLKKNAQLPCEKRLPDGSYLSTVYPSKRHRRQARGGITVRVIEYRLVGVPKAEPLYRLATSILDPEAAPAQELAALYHERWEMESSLDEFKTHLRGRAIVLRSKTPELVAQEFYGLMMTHFAVRGLMHEAALKGALDPDELSFVHAVRVIRRRMAQFAAIPARLRPGFHESVLSEILDERVSSSRGRYEQRAVKRKMSKWPIRRPARRTGRRAGPNPPTVVVRRR